MLPSLEGVTVHNKTLMGRTNFKMGEEGEKNFFEGVEYVKGLKEDNLRGKSSEIVWHLGEEV